MTPRSAAIVNLGCKVNQSEMEGAARLLREAGVPLVDPERGADLVLVNTCTVTAVADEKSRAAVRRARRANRDAAIVITGCSVQVGPEAFARVDERARLVGNDAKAAFLAELEALLATDGHATMSRPLPTLSGVDMVGATIDGIADDRASVERTRAFVKVQDGCSFYCTYCIIPTARGPERSLSPEAVLADVRRAIAAGHREVVLTGINIGTYDGGWSERGRAVPTHARRSRSPAWSAASWPRRPSSASGSAPSSPSTSTTSCSRRGSTARRARCRTCTCRSSRATTACCAAWAAAT